MGISHINVKNLRNILDADLELSPSINILYGNNGSGKTSFLEAIHFLGTAKSFRTSSAKFVINEKKETLTILGKVHRNSNVYKIGVEKTRQGTRAKISGSIVKKRSELATILPIKIISQESQRIYELGSKFRRQFLDWGAFHVEPQYAVIWKDYYRCLRQRNAFLRSTNTRSNKVIAFSNELLKYAKKIHDIRSQQVKCLKPIFKDVFNSLIQIDGVSLDYYPGWPQKTNLERFLDDNVNRDLHIGFTEYGPHRADLKILIDQKSLKEKLSGGQKKITYYALQLAQIVYLKSIKNIEISALIDDLSAELDNKSRNDLFESILKLKLQTFLTQIEPDDMKKHNISDKKMFHVKQGKIIEVGTYPARSYA